MTWMDYITYAEQTRGVALPEVYHRLAADGMLDWGHLDSSWDRNVLPTLLHHPPLVLINSDFLELPDAQTMRDAHFDCEAFFTLKPEYKQAFVPFIVTFTFDLYTFAYFDKRNAPIIARINHDDTSEIVAQDLPDWIFMVLLQAQNNYDFHTVDDATFRERLLLQLDTHRPYLKIEHYQLLTEIYSRPFLQDKRVRRLLSFEERTELINEHSPYNRRGEQFDPFIFD